MKLHLPSFVLGFGAGAASAVLYKRARPLLLELATAGYRLADAVTAKLAMRREDLEDLLAEARARARRVVGRDEATRAVPVA